MVATTRDRSAPGMAETEAELTARFGSAIRTERKRRRWSQAVFAERLGVSLDYVGMLERGERLPSFPVAIRAAALFDTTVSALLAPEGPEPESKPAEPWLTEATAILRALTPPALAIALAMLHAASSVAAGSSSGVRRARRK
jgi:transcriptional regulator with XRE-family HTH domain